MSAFGNNQLNLLYAQGIAEDIIAILVKCCKKMKADAFSGNLLPNNENKITNRLFNDYLENEHVYKLFHFQLQAPENYNSKTNLYAGIADIRVTLWDMLSLPTIYMLIECKRVDGKAPLNKEYIKEGVQRFIGDLPKYKSHYGRNIILGYVVSSINIPENVVKMEMLQAKLIEGVSISDFELRGYNSDWYIYSSESTSGEGISIILDHLFFNLSDAIIAN